MKALKIMLHLIIGLPDESIKPDATSNNSLHPTLIYINTKSRVKFDVSSLKSDQLTYTHINVVNIYIVFQTNL